jgi:hypothetical protein
MFVFNDFEDTSINDYFYNFGYSNTNSLRNMGSSFLYLVFGIIFLPILLFINKLLYFCPNRTRSVKEKLESLKKMMMWNFFLKLLMS